MCSRSTALWKHKTRNYRFTASFGKIRLQSWAWDTLACSASVSFLFDCNTHVANDMHRCTARLISLELRDNEADNPELKEQLCKIFEVGKS